MFRTPALLFVFGCLTAGSDFAQQPAAAPSGPAAPAQQAPAGIHLAARPAEDWSKLPVDRATLKVKLAAAPLGKSENSTYTSELIRLTWRQGDPIDMYVIKPRGVTKPPVVLYLYSYTFPADLARFRDDGWCRRVTRNGMAAVGFLSALTGDRIRNRPMKEWFIPELQESLGSSVHDVQVIIDYLAKRGDLDVNEVGMYGQGSGASIAILAAAADPRIKAVDALNPWGDWPDWLKETAGLHEDERAKLLAADFLQKVAPLDPVAWLPQLKTRELRVQQIMDDDGTPPAARDKIAAAVPAGDLVQYKDMAAHRDAWMKAGLSGWLADHLLPASQVQAAAPAAAPKPTVQ
jgi:dienelactone hydrolase